MTGKRKYSLVALVISLLGLLLILPSHYTSHYYPPAKNTTEAGEIRLGAWADSVYNTLSLEERIAQLMMILVYTHRDQSYYRSIERLVTQQKVGGLAFFKGGPLAQAKMTNYYQSKAQTPLLIAMDAEWGPSMRLDSTIVYPRQMTLGAISNEFLIYEFGIEVARQLKRLGVHVNFAPVVDINNNPSNPVINNRSFGECRYNVTRKSVAYMKGLQDGGIMANAKHFPGHGDTDSDSHHTLPFIKHSREIIDSIHLFPFRHMINNGLMSVMVAHLEIPALDPTPKQASTLSYPIVTELLQNEMGFKGLIFTDALDMKGVSDYFKPGELELKALQAGNDIMLLPENVPLAIKTIKQAVENGSISEELVNQKCRKVLYYKEIMGLNKYTPVDTRNLHKDLNSNRARQLNRRLIEASMTVLKNEDELIPIKRPDTLKIAALAIGAGKNNPFQATLSNYAGIELFSIGKEPSKAEADRLLQNLKKFNLVVVSFHSTSFAARRNYGINDKSIELLQRIAAETPVVVSLFANPYALASFRRVPNVKAFVVAHQEGKLYEEAAAQVIFGALPAKGKLPVSVSPYFPVYSGEQTTGNLRIRFGSPDMTGLNPDAFERIDSIVEDAIKQGAFPGCQIAIIKDGTMIYQKSFGHHTYEKKKLVSNSDIYDLASLTKIMATTLALMHLYDENKINLNKQLDSYLDWLKTTNKGDLIIADILAHQARLRAWIPFYVTTMLDGKPNSQYYQSEPSDEFPHRVAEKLYIHRSFRDSIYQRIMDSPLLTKKSYLYSDLGFILFTDLINQSSGMMLHHLVESRFYAPMGLNSLRFLPRLHFPLEQIVPSEDDTAFRKQILLGDVNDPAAAMLGGVAGHAGLFGNATEAAILMQMLLNGGDYAGKSYLKKQTIDRFTSVAFPQNKNRRGLGFDRPTQSKGSSNPAADGASQSSFGHSGFTGTYAWADPKHQMVFVFVSNRTFPSASNRKINQLAVRQKCHQVVYDAINQQRYLSIGRNK